MRTLITCMAILAAGCAARSLDDSTGPSITDGVTCSSSHRAPNTWTSSTLGTSGTFLVGTESGVLLAGVDQALMRSTDAGASWQTVATAPFGYSAASASGARIVLVGSTANGGPTLLQSLDDGATWSTLTAPSTSSAFNVVAAGTSSVYVNVYGSLFASHDLGATWTASNFSDKAFLSIWAQDDNEVFATVTADSTSTFVELPAYSACSTDGGTTFKEAQVASTCAEMWGVGGVLLTYGTLANTATACVARSTNDGKTFSASQLSFTDTVLDHAVFALSGNDRGDIAALTDSGSILYSTDNGASFAQLYPASTGFSFASGGVWVGPCGNAVILTSGGTLVIGH